MMFIIKCLGSDVWIGAVRQYNFISSLSASPKILPKVGRILCSEMFEFVRNVLCALMLKLYMILFEYIGTDTASWYAQHAHLSDVATGSDLLNFLISERDEERDISPASHGALPLGIMQIRLRSSPQSQLHFRAAECDHSAPSVTAKPTQNTGSKSGDIAEQFASAACMPCLSWYSRKNLGGGGGQVRGY